MDTAPVVKFGEGCGSKPTSGGDGFGIEGVLIGVDPAMLRRI